MNRESAAAARAAARRRAAENERASIEALRALIVGPERERLRSLESRDVPSVEYIAEKLPDAVHHSHGSGPLLTRALQPLVVDSVHDTVRRDPDRFADALYPAIAPAIRRAIAAAMRDLMRKIEQTFARRSAFANLRWRIEAARTGRTLAEVALAHSAYYRVEQLLLIHRESGLLLQHLVAPSVTAQDPAQVSAMLSAIDSFVHDAFHGDAHLEHFDLGELTCWIERGPSALLVGVVRGADPPGWAATMGRTLEAVHVSFRGELAAFRGDSASFATSRELLAPLLSGQPKAAIPPGTRRTLRGIALVGAIALTALALILSYRAERQSLADAHTFERAQTALLSVPGIVITSAGHKGHDEFRFAGLRDPSALDPAVVLARAGVSPTHARLQFEPYLSLDPGMIRARIEPALRPPPSVRWSLDGRVLRLHGSAPGRWIEQARWVARALPGVERVDLSGVQATDSRDTLRSASVALSSITIPFAYNDATVTRDAARALDAAAQQIRLVESAAADGRISLRIVVFGGSDPPGTIARNMALRAQRAAVVVEALVARGVARDHVIVDATGNPAAIDPSVSFDVDVEPEEALPSPTDSRRAGRGGGP